MKWSSPNELSPITSRFSFPSNDLEEQLEEPAAETEQEAEPEPEQEPEPEAQEEKPEPVLEETTPEETVEKSPSPVPADPAPVVQEDSRVIREGHFSLTFFIKFVLPRFKGVFIRPGRDLPEACKTLMLFLYRLSHVYLPHSCFLEEKPAISQQKFSGGCPEDCKGSQLDCTVIAKF